MDLYVEMGNELRELFKDLFDPEKRGLAKERMDAIMGIAVQIGGPIEMEAELLFLDVLRFLEHPDNEECIAILKEHALKLEQQTREL